MPARLSREQVVPVIRDVFRRHGYDGASLAVISDATGLGRASLYHHFPGGKEEMAEAALEDVAAMIDGRIITALRRREEPPEARLAAMAKELMEFHEGGRAACLCGVLALTAAPLRPQVRAIFERWLAALADLAREAGMARVQAGEAGEEALARIEGALILAASQDSPKPFRHALRDLPRILLRVAP
ncbi:MAG TPA: TetR/AcrR family transcriptional regulator [Stellaceae bacterium]|nr:TetR/AcrR family transcriptional regulator [Stellaceae bacterium]